MSDEDIILLGISSCLLGERVRYDGNHKRDDLILKQLGPRIHFMSICPEVGIGMGVPRPPIQLVSEGGSIRAVDVEDPSLDVTEQLTLFAQQLSPQLQAVSGFIFKSRSPSCGQHSTECSSANNHVSLGSGLFAAEIIRLNPGLPVAEESELHNPDSLNRFLEQVFAYHRLRQATKRS